MVGSSLKTKCSSEWRRIRKSDFIRHAATLLTANALSQVIALIVYPIVTRLYSPSDLGVFSLFLSITAVLSILSCGRYESAIVLPAEEKKASATFQLCLLLNAILFVLLLFPCLFAKNGIAHLFQSVALGRLLPLLPVLVLLTGVWQALSYMLIRHKKYNNISGYNLGQSIVNSAGKILFGVGQFFRTGLVWATIVGQATALTGSIIAARKKIKACLPFDKREMKNVAKEYANFPKFEMPHALANTLAGQLPILILSAYFDMAEIGLFSLGLTMGFRPINLFSNSVEQVLYKKTVENVQQKFPILPFLKEFCTKISFIVIPVFLLLLFITKPLFGWLFGAEWTTAGTYTQFMLPWLYFVLLTGSLSFIPKIFFKQKTAMFIEFAYIILRIIVLAIGVLLGSFKIAIILFCGVSALVIALQLIWYFSLVKEYERNI